MTHDQSNNLNNSDILEAIKYGLISYVRTVAKVVKGVISSDSKIQEELNFWDQLTQQDFSWLLDESDPLIQSPEEFFQDLATAISHLTRLNDLCNVISKRDLSIPSDLKI